MKRTYMKKGLGIIFMLGGICLFSACEQDDLYLGKPVDESQYEGIYKDNSFAICDAQSGSQITVVELYNQDFFKNYATYIRVELSKPANREMNAQVSIDPEYLVTYNKEHFTDFEMYPQTLIELGHTEIALEEDNEVPQTEIVQIAAGTKSGLLPLIIHYGEDVEKDKTFALPIKVIGQNGTPDNYTIYLIKNFSNSNDCNKKELNPEYDIKGCLFFEVNDVNPLNAFSFELGNGKLLWDVVVLFAANIKYDAVAGRPYLHCNPNVRYLLDNNETLIQPLRKRGIKVLLGVLGDHDDAGLAQLSRPAAKEFAREVAKFCQVYKLDGVNYDDEYSKENPDLSNPVFVTPSKEAAAYLCYETKQAMPDKWVSVYDYHKMYGVSYVDGHPVNEWIDLVVPDYGQTVQWIDGMYLDRCALFSMEFNRGTGGNLNSYSANQLQKGRGYRWFMGFSANPRYFMKEHEYSDSPVPSIWSRLTGVKDLYGFPLKEPSIYYEKNDPQPKPFGMLGN